LFDSPVTGRRGINRKYRNSIAIPISHIGKGICHAHPSLSKANEEAAFAEKKRTLNF
jgi:hypothetical protein